MPIIISSPWTSNVVSLSKVIHQPCRLLYVLYYYHVYIDLFATRRGLFFIVCEILLGHMSSK